MQQDETFAQWLETSANLMDPDGPQWVVSAWEHARCCLMEQRPDSDDERPTGADIEFLMGPVCEAVDHDRPGDFRADFAVAIDTYLHFLVHRGHDVSEARTALAGHLPVLDALDRVGYLVDTADPAEVEVLDGLPLTVTVRKILNRPTRSPDRYSDEWIDREFCRDVGLLAGGAVTAEGHELSSPDPQVRRRAARRLVAQWISYSITGPDSLVLNGGLEAFLAGLLAAVHGADVPSALLVCAAHLQSSVDEYRQREPGWLYAEELEGYLSLLSDVGIDVGIDVDGSCLRIRSALSTALFLAVVQIADDQELRRDEIAGWFAVFTGASPWVVDLAGARLETAG